MNGDTNKLLRKLSVVHERKAKAHFTEENLSARLIAGRDSSPDDPALTILFEHPASDDEILRLRNAIEAKLDAHNRPELGKKLHHEFISRELSDHALLQELERDALPKCCLKDLAALLLKGHILLCEWIIILADTYREPTPDQLLLNQRDLADKLDKAERTIQRWVNLGMPVAMPGKHPRYRLEDVQDWLSSRK